MLNELSPQGRNPIKGTALDVKLGAHKTITPLTVWAAGPRDTRPQRGCKHCVVSPQTLSSTYNTNYVHIIMYIYIY